MFVPAIQVCLETIEKYYGYTEYMDVYIMAMGKSLIQWPSSTIVIYFMASTWSNNKNDVNW